MSNYQDLKAVRCDRVDVGAAKNAYAYHRHTGHPSLCPAGSSSNITDVYGRPVSQNTRNGEGVDAACSQSSHFNLKNYLAYENMHRPYVQFYKTDTRCSSDTMGQVPRDRFVKNLYSGNF